MATYDFQKQLTAGEAHEDRLDQYFGRWYFILKVPREMQRYGIDRVFVRKTNIIPVTVEYKADSAATKSGNAFIETVSVDKADKPGWAYTSRASQLVYYLPGYDVAYVIEFQALRDQLESWRARYREQSIPNKGYNTRGILVPLQALQQVSTKVLFLDAA